MVESSFLKFLTFLIQVRINIKIIFGNQTNWYNQSVGAEDRATVETDSSAAQHRCQGRGLSDNSHRHLLSVTKPGTDTKAINSILDLDGFSSG